MFDFGSILLTLVGWAGAASTIAAYVLVTRRRIEPDSMTFHGMNLGGAIALCISASISGAWPSAMVNVIWIAIAVQTVLAAKRHVIKARIAAQARRQAELLRRAQRTELMRRMREAELVRLSRAHRVREPQPRRVRTNGRRRPVHLGSSELRPHVHPQGPAISTMR